MTDPVNTLRPLLPVPRWRYRFENFEKAYGLLKEALAQYRRCGLSPLETEGLAQRFEMTVELAWKTLKDYLEHQGVHLAQSTPRVVIKEAFAAQLLPQATVWMNMLDARNALAHTYNAVALNTVVEALATQFAPAIEALYTLLKQATLDDNDDATTAHP
jgi:nucleotidyltransferase substrate binding protein (TIGR01987 family)